MINLKKQTDLTERQQNLINELHQEFIKLNQSRAENNTSLFSHIILQQQEEINLQIVEDKAKEKIIIQDIINQFNSDCFHLLEEFSKLNIPVILDPIEIKDGFIMGGKLHIGVSSFHSDAFTIKLVVNWENRSIHGQGYSVYKPGVSYVLYDNTHTKYLNLSFIKNDYFLQRVGRLHKAYNK